MFKPFNYIFLAILLLIVASCAQVVTPTGGPKDTIPPKVLKSDPANYETNFSGNSLIIQFDEFVQVKDANNEIIISPMIGGSPKIKIKGKTVEIKFDTLPKANTTYTINLGKAIVDNNEGNVLDSNLFVFSTGNIIDTFEIKGKIMDAEWGKAEKNMFIMLYADTSDSIPLKNPPDYITKSNDNGEFKIMHIKKGKYRLFALSDLNSNYIFDLPDEKIAFSNNIIDLDSTVFVAELNAFKETVDKQFIVSSEFVQYGKIKMVFNLPVKNINVKPLNYEFKKEWFLMEENQKKDTLYLWLTEIDHLDSLILEITDENNVLDTLELEILKKPIENNNKGGSRGSGKLKALELNAQINATISNPLNFNDSLIINWNHPILSSNINKYILTQGDDTLSIQLKTIDNALRKQVINFNRKEDSTYNLVILPNAVEDIFNLKNDTLKFSFKIQNRNYYGTILLDIEGNIINSMNYIIDLTDEKNQIIKSCSTNNLKNIKFDYLAPGNYSFRLIVDVNNNNQWDTGNYLKNIQPEKTFIYNGSVTVKGNWDSNITWQLP
ncbi:MAG: Ig-like domain-containing protein [Bacteroidia bacterium]